MKDACDNVAKLCQLLHTEVCRNGGFSTQISQLKIHAPESCARRITKLLGDTQLQRTSTHTHTHTYTSDVADGTVTSKKHTGNQKSGIVSVLQRFPNVFLVDVHCNPHLVQLCNVNFRANHHGSENGCPCGHCHDTTDGGHDQEVNSAAAKLTERIRYILKQRECKMARRRNRPSDANDPFAGAKPKPATLGWVAKKVLLELHRYVRLLGPSERPTVRVDPSIDNNHNNSNSSDKAVELFGEEWWTLSIPLLYKLLQQESVPIVTRISANPAQGVGYPTEKNHAKRMGTKLPNSLGEITTVTLPERVRVRDGNHDIQSNPCVLTEPSVAGSIATRVRTILQNNPAVAVGGMDVGRLLSDPKLRQLLGGHDFCRMVEADRETTREQQHPSPVFEGLVLFRDHGRGVHSGGNVRIGFGPLALPKPGEHTLFSPGVPCGNERNKHRLETANDEEGLYSLTARRTALAMANGLSNALFRSRPQEANVNGDHPPTDTNVNVTRRRRPTNQTTVLPCATETGKQKNGPCPYRTKSVCIDMTAGIGGNTIACSRYFARVVSYEIDPTRANLCQRNVNNYSARNDNNGLPKGIVDVTCANSLEMLPQLAEKYRGPSSNPDIGGCFTGIGIGIAVMLDPPWGGRNYKRANSARHSEDDDYGLADMGLGLGPAPLAKVLMDISHHLAPLVIGLKVPLGFAVNDFTDTIGGTYGYRKGVNANDDTGTCTSPSTATATYTANNRQTKYLFDIVSIKKYPGQLFVVYNVT